MGISNQQFAQIVASLGPFPASVPDAPRNPYSTRYGKILDVEKFTAWELAHRRCLDCPGPRSPKCCRRGM